MMAWYNTIAPSQEARFIAVCMSLANTVHFFLMDQCCSDRVSNLIMTVQVYFSTLEHLKSGPGPGLIHLCWP